VSTPEEELAQFREFLGGDPLRPAFDPVNASDEDFERFLNGDVYDIEARARELKADKDAREAAEFLDFAKMEMISKGYDPETKTWVRPEVPADPADAAMPTQYQDDSGAPLVSLARLAQFHDHESEIGSMSDDQFSSFLAARDAGKTTVFGSELLDNDTVNEIAAKYGLGD
jgi:hypothetical protein